MNTTTKFYALKKENGEFIPYFNEGALNTVPMIYDKIGVARHKATLFKGTEVVQVYPLYQLLLDGTSIYFLTKESYIEIKDQLDLTDSLFTYAQLSNPNIIDLLDDKDGCYEIDTIINALTLAKKLGLTYVQTGDEFFTIIKN